MSIDAPETRIRILKAALHLLEAGEGKPVPMSAVAKEAGLTRQAVYLHFLSRAELLIATTHYVDEIFGGEARLVASRTATSGIERLDAYVEAWCDYIPEVYGVARALMALAGSDREATNAWRDRMQDMWEGCEAAIIALKRDDQLVSQYSVREASDLLWMLLSVRNWEALCLERDWSQEAFVRAQKLAARRLLLKS